MSVDPCWTGLFPDETIPVILRVVQRCAAKLEKRAPCESENSLSDRLYHRILRDREYRDLVPAQLKREASVYRDDSPVDEDCEPPHPGPIGRVDFVFENGTGLAKPYPEFVIEAKRLHVSFPRAGWHSLVNEYVSGDQGMMCFVSERYATAQQVGAMLGYVFDRDVSKARTAVSATVERHRSKLRLKTASRYSATNLSGLKIDESWHTLDRREFRLFHLFAKV